LSTCPNSGHRAAVLEAIKTWADERETVLEVIRGLRELCENLGDQLAELRWRQLGTQFDSPHAAYRAMKQWGDEECARIEEESRKRSKMDDA
jgi:hypothetical protein